MPSGYTRCNYIPDGGVQCENFIPVQSGPKCPLHIGHVSADLAARDENKLPYLEIRNKEAQSCYLMTMDELDEHIARLEQVIETEKARAYSARAVRADKVDKLSDEERQVRRELQKQINANKASEATKAREPKKPTIKSDPVKFFMQTYKITEAEARQKLGLE